MKLASASRDTDIRGQQVHQTHRTRFQGLGRHRIVLTTFWTRRCVPSVNTIAITQSRRTRFSTTYTAFCTHRAIVRQFANDLSKELPRIPFAPDFHAFAEAGKALAGLHLGYETCEQYPLFLVFAHDGEPQPHHFRLTEKAMRFATPAKTTLIINEHVRLTASQRWRIGMWSTAERRWSGSLTVTRLSGTRRAAFSTTRTAGLKIREIWSRQSSASFM